MYPYFYDLLQRNKILICILVCMFIILLIAKPLIVNMNFNINLRSTTGGGGVRKHKMQKRK